MWVFLKIVCHITLEDAFCASYWTSYSYAQFGLYLLNHIGTAMVAFKRTTVDLHKLWRWAMPAKSCACGTVQNQLIIWLCSNTVSNWLDME